MQTLNDDIDFLAFLAKQEAQFIERASRWGDEVVAEIAGVGPARGELMPWSKTHDCLSFRPGEVTVWGGYSGHGKSLMLNQVCAWSLRNLKWLIASLEMPPRKTLRRMLSQVSGVTEPSESYAKRFLQWTDDRLWLYDQTDTVESKRILGMVHYAAQELGINHIVIDSLMKCGFRGNKDAISVQQVEFVDRLCWAAKTHNVHVHLVHHMRKGEGHKSEYQRPGKHDFRGAGELVDLVDNALIVHRNKRKEESQEGSDSEPDATMECVKNRYGDWEGVFKFWFTPAGQFVSAPGRTMSYPEQRANTGLVVNAE